MKYLLLIYGDEAAMEASMAGMTAEVLLLGGEKSPGFLREVLDVLHGTLPRSRRIELRRMGHGGPSSGGQPERGERRPTARQPRCRRPGAHPRSRRITRCLGIPGD